MFNEVRIRFRDFTPRSFTQSTATCLTPSAETERRFSGEIQHSAAEITGVARRRCTWRTVHAVSLGMRTAFCPGTLKRTTSRDPSWYWRRESKHGRSKRCSEISTNFYALSYKQLNLKTIYFWKSWWKSRQNVQIKGTEDLAMGLKDGFG